VSRVGIRLLLSRLLADLPLEALEKHSRVFKTARKRYLGPVEDIAELAKRIDRDRVERARKMTLIEKFSAGAELFEQACEVTRAGIRGQHPAWDEDQVEAELVGRLEIDRKIEERLAR